MSKYNCSHIPSKVSSDNVYYSGAYLSTIDVSPNEYLTSILQKINDYDFGATSCVTCDNGVPVFAGIKNSFALSTDANGKIITATDVYNKTEVDDLIISGDTNIGNTNLTLSSSRSLNGNGNGLVFSNLADFNLYANNVQFISTSSSSFGFSTNTSIVTLDLSLISDSIKNFQLPNTSGVIALQSYVTTSTANALASANAYTDTQDAANLATAKAYTDTQITANNTNLDNTYAKKPSELTTDNAGNLTSSALANKELLILMTSGIIFERGVHFNKAFSSNTVTMIPPNTLLATHNYTPIYG